MFFLAILLVFTPFFSFVAYAENDKPPLEIHGDMDSESSDDSQKGADTQSDSFTLTPDSKWKEEQPEFYRTPSSSTKGIKGINVPYMFWYDHFLWKETEPLNQYAEKSFQLNGKNAYAIIVSDKKEFSLEDLDDIVIKNAKESGFGSVKILSTERRNVNGNDVLFIHWQALFQGIDVDFLSYVYSGPAGSVFIHSYSPTFLFRKNSRAMELFLNGFTLPGETNKKQRIEND